MARDKRGHPPEPDVDEVLNDLAANDADSHVAGPTTRNAAGDMRRAAAKVVGAMGASRKTDPDLLAEPESGHPRSGSRAALRSFQEVPPDMAGELHLEVANEQIAQSANTTAVKSPARRSPQANSKTGPDAGGIGPGDRARVPAPGAAVSAPKGELVRGHPTATQAGGRSQSSTGEEKPPKRSARGGTTNTRPLVKRISRER